jgi:hypothetical protein
MRHPVDDPVIGPRLGPADTALIMASLEMRARVFLTSAELLADTNAELAARDRASADRCRALADKRHRLHSCMKGDRG